MLQKLAGRRLEPGGRAGALIPTEVTAYHYNEGVKDAHSPDKKGEGWTIGGLLKDTTLTMTFDGYIQYVDDGGIERRSAFYREYDFDAERFGGPDDPNREYVD
jgi:hypothetical protein